MTRFLLFAFLALAATVLVQSNLSAADHYVQTNTRLAQDESGNAKTADPSTTPDTGSGDESNKPAPDQE